MSLAAANEIQATEQLTDEDAFTMTSS